MSLARETSRASYDHLLFRLEKEQDFTKNTASLGDPIKSVSEGRKFLRSTPPAKVRARIPIKSRIQVRYFCSWLKGARGELCSKDTESGPNKTHSPTPYSNNFIFEAITSANQRPAQKPNIILTLHERPKPRDRGEPQLGAPS